MQLQRDDQGWTFVIVGALSPTTSPFARGELTQLAMENLCMTLHKCSRLLEIFLSRRKGKRKQREKLRKGNDES